MYDRIFLTIKEKELLNMKVLVLSGNIFEEKEINNTLEDLQQIVGGYIEIPFLSPTFNDNKIDVIINDEGKFIEGLEPEIAIVGKETNAILDIVYGNCIFASHTAEGDTIGLNDEQINIVKEKLKSDIVLYDRKGDRHYLAKELFV